MKRLPLLLSIALALLVIQPGSASAGRNANGALFVHTNDSYNYSSQTVCTAPEGSPTTCEEIVTQSDRDAGAVLWLLAAFSPASSPGVTVIYFGIDYDDVNLDPAIAYRFCGPAGSLEIPDTDWPYTGRGNSVAFGSPIYSILFPFYAFKADNYGGVGPFFCTAINPIGGYAAFVDDSNPPTLDYVYRFGCVRWHEQGSVDCWDEPTGACCFADGSCQLLTAAECVAAGGQYFGDNVPCDPNPCVPCWYACCLPDGSCIHVCEPECNDQGGEFHFGLFCEPGLCLQPEGACCIPPCYDCYILTEENCLAQGGVFFGDGTVCDPNPCAEPPGACCLDDGTCIEVVRVECALQGGEHLGCGVACAPGSCEPTAVERTTWGRIRSTYR
jgi:hypothetical protein